MGTFRVHVARTQQEYGAVTVKAANAAAAEVNVARLLAAGVESQAYCDLVNSIRWRAADATSNERVLDVERVKP